jgi:hypothetical protein
MVTKFFWFPFNGVGAWDGDQMFMLTKKGGMSHAFGKPLTRAFKKDAIS